MVLGALQATRFSSSLQRLGCLVNRLAVCGRLDGYPIQVTPQSNFLTTDPLYVGLWRGKQDEVSSNVLVCQVLVGAGS